MGFLGVCSIVLALRLHAGDHVTERAAIDSRIQWVLPPDRIKAFAASGFVIDEHRTTQLSGSATVTRSAGGLMTLSGIVHISVADLARHQHSEYSELQTATVNSRDENPTGAAVGIESAATAELPASPVCVGQRWQTHLPVVTTLGSGSIEIEHTVAGIANGLIQVDVRGAGVIRGREYNLPRLLPGSIGLAGSFWYDPNSGLVTQESYSVRNRLVKTVRGKTIGFDESETADVSTHVSGP
jgi:hypothetical protein